MSDGEVGMQLHLESRVDDLEATGKRVLTAGATRFEHQPNADHCLVYADPVGPGEAVGDQVGGVGLEVVRDLGLLAHQRFEVAVRLFDCQRVSRYGV